MPKKKVSIIVPAYNEEENIDFAYSSFKSSLNWNLFDYEILFIDDGSCDATFSKIEAIHKKDKRFKGIKFKKNFGKSAALFAGFSHCSGEYIVTIDADMQVDPSNIPIFLDKLENENYDLIVGWRHKRKDTFSKRFFSKIFNFLVRTITKIKIHDSDCDLKVFRRDMLKDLNLYGGIFRYIPSIAYNKGYKTGEIKISHNIRRHGTAKFSNYSRLFTGFLDLITIKFLISYRYTPLYVFGTIGIIFSFLGSLTGARYFYLWYTKGWVLSEVAGNRPLLILAVFLVILGVQFISLGLLGEMITHNNPRKDVYSIEKII